MSNLHSLPKSLKIGNQQIKLIVGLGNQGDRFKRNRHNVGFLILDNWVGQFNFLENKKLNCLFYKLGDVLYAKPLGFINNSGDAVSKIINFFQLSPQEILVVQDDLDIKPGDFKISFDRGDAGHNGIKDIFLKLGGDRSFYRLRYGIGRPQNKLIKVEDFVLGDLSSEELEKIEDLKINQIFS